MILRRHKLKIRFVSIFVGTAVVAFSLINGRYLYANTRYYVGSGPKPLASGQPTPSRPPITESNRPLPDSAWLTIPKLGLSVPVVFGVPDDITKIYQSLNRGVVHYTASPKPGLPGAATILGHSSDYIWKKN